MNIQKYLFSVALFFTLGVGMVGAWSGLIASPGDIITSTKWNEMINKILPVYSTGGLTGSVGIGDSTPDHKLDVAGNIGLNTSSYINFGDTDGSSGYGLRDNAGTIQFKNSAGSWTNIPLTGGGGNDDLGNHTAIQNIALDTYWLSGDGDDEGIQIDSTGNVTIGSATPNHLLSVGGNIGLNSSSYINFGTIDGTSGYGLRDNAGTIQFKNSAGSWTNIPSSGGVSSVFGRSGAVIAVSGDYNGTQITNTAAGNIAATDVQSAINELDTEKQATITGGATTITTSNLTTNRALVSDASGKVGVSAVTSTQLGYVSGVTSAIQTQLNGKQATITGGATTITTSNLTTNRALVSDVSGKVGVSSITDTELGYLSGLSSGIQSQLNTKADTASPIFTGDPTAPTPATADNDTSIATTAFVKAQGYSTSSGIGTLNTLNAATQTFAVGSSGTDFNISSLTSTHTFNIPDASATARGMMTTGTQIFAGNKTFNGNVNINSNTSLGDANTDTLTINGTAVSIPNNLNFDTNTLFLDAGNNRVGIGVGTANAALHIKAGTATANTAPLKFTSGTNLTTAEAGAMEYNGIQLFFSPSTTRNILAQVSGSTALTSGSIAFATTNGYLTQDNANLFWDDTNNRLGIGDSTPGNKIEITSGVAGTSGLRFTNLTSTSTNGTVNGKNLSVDTNGDVYMVPEFRQRVILGSDVINNNAVANTIADVTGLSWAVTSGTRYQFECKIRYTSAATTTGSRWSINGPTTSVLSFTSNYALTATTRTFNNGTTYNTPAASNTSSAATTGNIAIIEGFITPSANGTVIVRFASEIANSAITAKAGSTCEYWSY